MPPFPPQCCSSQWIYPAVSDSRCAAVTSFSLRVLIHFTLKSHVPRSELLSHWDLIREYSREAFPSPEPALAAWHRSQTNRHFGPRERCVETRRRGLVGVQGYLVPTLSLRPITSTRWSPPSQTEPRRHLSSANFSARHKLSPPVERGRACDFVRRLVQHPHAEGLTIDALWVMIDLPDPQAFESLSCPQLVRTTTAQGK